MHDVPMGEHLLQFQWVGGAILYTEVMHRRALERAELVVYVTSAVPICDPECQVEAWDGYLAAATELKKTWNDVPWLFVLNKIDRGSTNFLLHRIPEAYRDQIIQTCAKDGRGVDILWQRILETVAKLA